MMDDITRRRFLGSTAVAVASGSAAQALGSNAMKQAPPAAAPGKRPVVIGSANAHYTEEQRRARKIPREAEDVVSRVMRLINKGDDPLDSIVAGINIIENDVHDHSVGKGGLPNEDGVVELDSSVMHGPTHKAGAVASLQNIANPSSVALLVMRRTDHVLLVGEGALRFARAHGFKEEDLLTEESRRIWLEWKENLSANDNWVAPASAPAGARSDARSRKIPWTHGTINCLAVTSAGDVAGCTSTSGLSWKLPGRVGDSPIIGAGLYVDNAVGAAGSTGRGEANLQNCCSFLIVELMRNGMAPQEACMKALERVVEHNEPRLKNRMGRPTFDLKFYALARDGRFGGASMYSGPAGKPPRMSVNDGQPRHVDLPHLFEGEAD